MPIFNPTNFDSDFYSRRFSIPLGMVSLVSGVVALTTPASSLVALYSGISLLSGLGAAVAQRGVEIKDEYYRLYEQNRVNMDVFQRAHNTVFKPPMLEAQPVLEMPKLKDAEIALLDLLKKRNKYAFVILLASQGQGKTTTATVMQMLSKTTNTISIVASPHIKRGDFPAANYLIHPQMATTETGDIDLNQVRRDVRDSVGLMSGEEDTEISMSDLVKQADGRELHCSIWQSVLALYNEFIERMAFCQNNAENVDKLQPIDFYIDEAPATYIRMAKKEFSIESNEYKASELWQSMFVQPAMMEFRKYKIRVFMLTQTQTVKNLGMEGMSELRDEYCYVRLGQAAIDHAVSVGYNEATLSMMSDAKFPLTINDDVYGAISSDRIQMYEDFAINMGHQTLKPIPWETGVSKASHYANANIKRVNPVADEVPMYLKDKDLDELWSLYNEGIALGYTPKSKSMKKLLGLPTGNGNQSSDVSEAIDYLVNKFSPM